METKIVHELLCVLFTQGYTTSQALALIAATGALALARKIISANENKVTKETKGLRYLLNKQN